MSYPAQPADAGPTAAPRRPVTVDVAAGLLALMGLVGLGYAIATLTVVPGTLDRFRDSARGADPVDVEDYVAVVWLFAALATALAVILFALFVALAFALRRGSRAARIGTWVVCGLGILFGCVSTVAVAAQRSGDGNPAALGTVLSGSYPDSWIGLNLGLAIAQMVGYLVVALLLLAAPGAFFGGRRDAGPAAYRGLPTLGGQPGQFPPPGGPYAAAPAAFGQQSDPYAPGQPSPYAPLPGYAPAGYPAGPGQVAPGWVAPGSGVPASAAPGYYPPGPYAPAPGTAMPAPYPPGAPAPASAPPAAHPTAPGTSTPPGPYPPGTAPTTGPYPPGTAPTTAAPSPWAAPAAAPPPPAAAPATPAAAPPPVGATAVPAPQPPTAPGQPAAGAPAAGTTGDSAPSPSATTDPAHRTPRDDQGPRASD